MQRPDKGAKENRDPDLFDVPIDLLSVEVLKP